MTIPPKRDRFYGSEPKVYGMHTAKYLFRAMRIVTVAVFVAHGCFLFVCVCECNSCGFQLKFAMLFK